MDHTTLDTVKEWLAPGHGYLIIMSAENSSSYAHCPLWFLFQMLKHQFNPIPHGGGGADSTRLQIVFVTSARDTAEPQKVVTFPKI